MYAVREYNFYLIITNCLHANIFHIALRRPKCLFRWRAAWLARHTSQLFEQLKNIFPNIGVVLLYYLQVERRVYL